MNEAIMDVGGLTVPPQGREPLRVGMIGVGGYGARRRLGMRETQSYEIVCCYEWNAQTALACQKQEGSAIVKSVDELVRYPGIEAVVISSGAKYHAEQILAALAQGLHVFVEKPLCASAAELKAILEAADSSGRVVMVGHVDHSALGSSAWLKSQIETGALGKIATFQMTTAHAGGLIIREGEWRGDAQSNPGGMLFQCGVHALHELMYYFGPVEAVSGMMRYDVHSTKTADVALCHLRFADGLLGSLDAFHVTPYRHSLHVFGTEAALYRDSRYFEEGVRFWLQKRNPQSGYEAREELKPQPGFDEWMPLRRFYRAIRFGEPPDNSLESAARAVATVFAAEESARRGSWVSLAEMFPQLVPPGKS